MITAIYRYERFDPAVNKELWRRIPGWKLRFTWLKAWLERDKAARIGYRAWLYARVSSGGEWLTGDMLDWNQEICQMNDYYKFLGYTADYRARYARMTWWKLRRQWFKDVIDAVKRKLASRDDTNLRAVLDYKEWRSNQDFENGYWFNGNEVIK